MSEYNEEWERERERRKERERAAIKREINELQRKVDYADELISEFIACNALISDSLSEWNSAYAAYKGNEMASVVMVTDRFEGCIAEKLASEVPETVGSMDIAVFRMENLQGKINSQLQKLHRYAENLRTRIRHLWDRYHSI